jgi:hypothetical protein
LSLNDSVPPRLVLLGLLTAVLATAAAIGATSACLTDPPPDLPLPSQPPTIVHVSLQPPEGPITSLPEFQVPIRVADPTESCQYSVWDEYTPFDFIACRPCDPSTFDGGVVTIQFTLNTATFNPTWCHTIYFAVASAFPDSQCRDGNDVATWVYEPPSSTCTSYDAGGLDGAFPEAAATDALPVVPDSGDEP